MSDELLAALTEWRDAREAIFAAGDALNPKDGPAFFNRLGAAELRLMRLARALAPT